MQIQDRKAIANSRQKSYIKFQIEKLQKILDQKFSENKKDGKALSNSKQKAISNEQVRNFMQIIKRLDFGVTNAPKSN